MRAVDENSLELARQRASQAGESLSLEHKSWLDLDKPADKAHLIRSCFALRNYGGGWLIIGIDNGTGKRSENAPADIRETYDSDRITGLLADHATGPFDVGLFYPEVEGHLVAAIRVESGVQTPVMTRKGIDGEKLLADTIYCRTIHGGQVSSIKAGHKDLQAILDTCLRNREANIGEFVRRHWADLTQEVSQLQSTKERELENSFSKGDSRFRQVLIDNQLDQIQEPGFFSVGVVWDGTLPDSLATEKFYRTLVLAHPNISGWPIWMDPLRVQGQRWVQDDVWEGLIAIVKRSEQTSIFNHLDYSRWDPRGSFFYRGAIFDDLPFMEDQTGGIGITLDRGLVMLQVAESMYTAQKMVRALFEAQSAQVPEHLYFRFMFEGLHGRRLVTSNPNYFRSLSQPNATQSKSVFARLRMDAAQTAINEQTCFVLRPLFAQFGGEDLQQATVDDLLRGFWKRA